MTIAERFSGAKYNVASKLHRLKANTWDSDNKFVKAGTRGVTRGAVVVGGLSALGVLAGCDLNLPTDKNDNGTTVNHVGNETPTTHNPELQISDPNTLLFLKAGIDYGSMDVSQKAVLTSYWNTALDQMQDITSLVHKGDASSFFFYREDAMDSGIHLKGEMSKYDIQRQAQFGKIIQFKGVDGKMHDLSMPHLYQSDPNGNQYKPNSVDYTSKNQHMIPGFWGGYVKVGDKYVFMELLPNATEITKAQYDAFKQNGTIEVEGNDTVGYYKVDGYKVALFQVDGQHRVVVEAGRDYGRGGNFGNTPEEIISGGESGSTAAMDNGRIGEMGIIVYGNDSNANKQLVNYINTGESQPSFVLDKNTKVSISTDKSGQPVYNLDVPQSTLDDLPYIEGILMNQS